MGQSIVKSGHGSHWAGTIAAALALATAGSACWPTPHYSVNAWVSMPDTEPNLSWALVWLEAYAPSDLVEGRPKANAEPLFSGYNVREFEPGQAQHFESMEPGKSREVHAFAWIDVDASSWDPDGPRDGAKPSAGDYVCVSRAETYDARLVCDQRVGGAQPPKSVVIGTLRFAWFSPAELRGSPLRVRAEAYDPADIEPPSASETCLTHGNPRPDAAPIWSTADHPEAVMLSDDWDMHSGQGLNVIFAVPVAPRPLRLWVVVEALDETGEVRARAASLNDSMSKADATLFVPEHQGLIARATGWHDFNLFRTEKNWRESCNDG